MNTLADYYVPEWISTLFLISIPLPFILISIFVYRESKKIKNHVVLPVVLGFFVLYVAYVLYAGSRGLFNEVFFPPKVLLFSTFPYAFLLFGAVYYTKTYKKIVDQASLESLISLHIFRVIGIFFVLLAWHDTLPKAFAYIAGIGDVVTALASVFVVKAIVNKKAYAKKLALYWNIFGTVDILFTAIAANVITKISIDTGIMGVDTLAKFPFFLIPAFAPPTILFIHWTIFNKLKNFSA
jgi:cbb3-type cytochrome oxidase subunit 3